MDDLGLQFTAALSQLAADAPLLFVVGYWADSRLKHGCALLERAVTALESIAADVRDIE